MKRLLLSKNIFVLLIVFQLSIVGISANNKALPSIPANALSAITQKELKRHLSFLASPELGGRYTFSDGNRIAARYLASQLESFGYRGAAQNGSFFQNIKFAGELIDAKNSYLKITTSLPNSDNKDFAFGKDFFTTTVTNLSVEASVVFVGYGVSLPGVQDDYQNVDVKDKIVLLSANLPKSLSRQASYSQYGARAAYDRGAKAVLVLPEEETTPNWSKYRVEEEDLFQMVKTNESKLPIAKLPEIDISVELAKILLDSINLSLSDYFEADQVSKKHSTKALPVSLSLNLSVETLYKQTQNVVAVYEGSDPNLKNEYVLLSAHYDHLKSDSKNVYCGADDDASGTSAILTIAQVLAEGTLPKRSILVVFHTGEEMGLQGSSYFVDVEPLIPLSNIIVNLNADMIGRSRTGEKISFLDRELTDKESIYLIGSDKHSSELHKLSEQTNTEVSKMKIDYTYNQESHPSRLFYRSDHYNYARHGIPIIFYFTGLHADYHKSTDTIEKIDFDKLARITRLIYATAWRVANLENRLVIDRWKK